MITSTVLADGRSEGAPVVAREGLASGLPVVATAVGGLLDLADYAEVLLVPDGDVSAIAEACRAHLSLGRPHPDRRVDLVRELDWYTVLPRLLAPLGL